MSHRHPHDHDHSHDAAPAARRASGLRVIDPAEGPSPAPTASVSRRGFVQVVGSGAAISSLAVACHRPRQKIIPYVRRPPEVTPGKSLHFASAVPAGAFGSGVIIESHEGRPTKIEGNPEHPDSLGASTAADQAYLVGLYDTDRARQLLHKGAPITWTGLLFHLKNRGKDLEADGGAGLRFLVEPDASPLLADLRARILQRFPSAKFVAYSGTGGDNVAAGARLAYDRELEVSHDLTQAKVVLALDSDFLDEGPETLRMNRTFSAARDPGAEMNRLYVVEPTPTVTGMIADHRLRVRGSAVSAVAQALLAELVTILGRDQLGPLADLPGGGPDAGVDARWVKAVAGDLARSRGRSAILVGPRQPAQVHAIAHAINFALGNVGTTVKYRDALLPDRSSGAAALGALAEEIAAGKVDTLVITAGNPVYTAPSDFKLDKLLARVANTLYIGMYADETAAVVGTFVPSAHRLEVWGDARATDGTTTLAQPLIEPLFSPHTAADLLAAFLGEGDAGSHKLLKDFWARKAAAEGLMTAAGGFDAHWEHWLARGIVPGTTAALVETLQLDGAAVAARLRPLMAPAGNRNGLELTFAIDKRVQDGRTANNPWLQELPHPVTKITWDNTVLLSMGTAAKMGLKTGDEVQVKVGDRLVTGPVYVQPGQADDVVTVALGYGRRGSETVALNVGFNAGVLRTSEAMWFAPGASVTEVGSRYTFGITQSHWSDEERGPAKAGSLKDFLDHASEFHHKLKNERGLIKWQIHEPHDYSKEQYKWGMSIDLNKCTGCGACVMACQAENNIPVVGREQVFRGREMHWIRIDRYYADAPNYGEDKDKIFDDTAVISQPVMCVHCETAPCEYVCPVNATVHSDEGLNEMVYNRCVGTRYCSNNCPYKARRFNFLDFHGEPHEVETMVRNPDVTVRSRGIMEKCTYCVQRIERARIDTRIEGRAIADGEVQTACQQTCPAQAIEFGSLADSRARVLQKHNDSRRYDLLHELNTRPRTAYLARVRNPNPELV